MELVFASLIGGGLAGAVAVRRTFARVIPKPLPRAAGPAPDRGEAVRRVLKHLQRRTIGELEEGTAAVIEGTVLALPGVPLLRAPVTGTECLGYHLDIRATELTDGFHFPQLREDARCVTISVTDDTGTVLVSGDGLELAVTDGPIGRWDPPLPAQIAALVPPTYHFWGLTVEEGLLLPGARILVCGVAVREPTATDYRDGQTTLTLRATSTFPLVASTDRDLFQTGDRPIAPEELRKKREP